MFIEIGSGDGICWIGGMRVYTLWGIIDRVERVVGGWLKSRIE